jgi:pilus assembly protein CpaE
MASKDINIGIIAPSAEVREMLRIQVSATGLASVEVESDQYCVTSGDRSTRRFVEARPDILIIDMQDAQSAIQSLHVLNTAVPEMWLFVSSASTDPQLIIETMRAGAREFLSKPIPPRNLSQALGRYIAEKQRREKSIGKIYCVTAAKGGVGATTLSINLATSLANMTKTQTALVDLCNPVGDIAAQLNLRPHFTIVDALASASRLDAVLLESYMSHAHGVAVLPGPKDFRTGHIPGADALARLLEVTAQTYTHSVIDISSSLDQEVLQVAAQMASRVVVVTTSELPSLWRTERLLRYFATAGIDEKVRLVVNRSRKSDEIADNEIEKALKRSLYWKLPNNYVVTSKATNTGNPVVAENHSELARSYRELARQLAEVPAPEKPRGFFRLFSS